MSHFGGPYWFLKHFSYPPQNFSQRASFKHPYDDFLNDDFWLKNVKLVKTQKFCRHRVNQSFFLASSYSHFLIGWIFRKLALFVFLILFEFYFSSICLLKSIKTFSFSFRWLKTCFRQNSQYIRPHISHNVFQVRIEFLQVLSLEKTFCFLTPLHTRICVLLRIGRCISYWSSHA